MWISWCLHFLLWEQMVLHDHVEQEREEEWTYVSPLEMVLVEEQMCANIISGGVFCGRVSLPRRQHRRYHCDLVELPTSSLDRYFDDEDVTMSCFLFPRRTKWI
jgi:hypothetical protein